MGLCFPKVSVWPLFICESCTVRSVLDRELMGARDHLLLRLERMRLLDLAHAWATDTTEKYQGKLKFAQRFDFYFGVNLLSSPTLDRPPSGPELAVMWAELFYSLRDGQEQGSTVTFGTVRSLRSALSQYLATQLVVAHPGHASLDRHQRMTLQLPRPTDTAACTYFTKGLRSRMGDNPNPSQALQHRQIAALDEHFRHQFRLASSIERKCYWARAGIANLCLWLGWLRSAETFALRWADISIVDPRNAASADLPVGTGCVQLKLSPETKSNRNQAADVVIAYHSFTGLGLGPWLKRLRRELDAPLNWGEDHRLLFSHSDGRPWDSRYYRQHFLYPGLHQLRSAGDPFLLAFNGQPGNTLEEKFWSLHCYRRGARTHVSRKHKTLGTRAATGPETYEHARWRRRRSSEDIDVIYRQWSLRERLTITQWCM